GLELLHAEDVDVLVVGRIDADLAEVHGAWIEAVDAGPGFAAVGGLVDAAVLVGVGSLLVLLVRGLSAIEGVIGAVFLGAAGTERPAATAALAARERRTLDELDFHDLALRIVAERELHLVADRVVADFLQEIVVGFDRRLADGDDNVLLLEPGLIGGP